MRNSHKYDFDLIVLGTGGGGSVASHIAAREGKRVAVVEPGKFGGECPNWGCVPTKSLLQAASVYDAAKRGGQFGIRANALGYNYPMIKKWKDLAVYRTGTSMGKTIFDNEGITVIRGAGKFASPHEITVNGRNYSAEKFLIATGTRDFIPPIEGLQDVGYLTFKEAINLTRPPKSLFIIGGGAIGCEFAELFAIFGTKIYITDITPRLLVKEDPEVGELIAEVFTEERGMSVFTGTTVTKIVKEGIGKRVFFKHNEKTQSVKVDDVLLASGKLANVDIDLENAGVSYTPRSIETNEHMQTSAKHIYAAGDVTGPYMYTHMAIYQSRIAAHNMFHRKKVVANYHAVPRCVFLTPEIASVGMSEFECTNAGLAIRTATSPISIIGRANTSNVDRGFVKVITDPKGVLLGASIVSPHAGEMIHELTLAIQHRMTASDITSTIHAFPTWSEAVRTACSKVQRV